MSSVVTFFHIVDVEFLPYIRLNMLLVSLYIDCICFTKAKTKTCMSSIVTVSASTFNVINLF